MRYNLKTHKIEAIKRLQVLIDREAIVDITEKRKSKTVSQNAYLHAILSMAAIYFGCTLDEVKGIFKKGVSVSPGGDWILKYIEIGDYKHGEYRSISAFNSMEISIFVESVRAFSNTHGCYLPTSDQYKMDREKYDNEIENQKQYI